MKLAVSNIAWSPDERLDAYAILQEAGIAGLEIAPGLLFHASADPFVPSADEARRALEEIADAELELVSMQSLLFGMEGAALFEGKPARRAFEIGMHRAIALAGRFGIPNLVFGSPAQRRIPEGMPMERALDEAASVFRTLGDEAALAGTRIAIEANPAAYGTNFLTSLADAESFVRRVNHPNIAAILDIGAMHLNGEYPEVPARIPALAALLSHVHVSEANLAPAPAERTDLAPTFWALRKVGYDKSVSIEMRRPEGGLDELERCVERLVDAHTQVEVADA
ncbi:MAG: sugar phosphate isomerase/epimerase family protein [Pseudomonadota bacterium]